jgi:predicted lipoprotein with Yx(FWY)xxD motif
MKTTRRGCVRRAPIALLITAAAAIGTVSVSPAGAAVASRSRVIVSTQSIGNMGKVLVSKGLALYTLTPSATACDSACLAIWPALTVPAGVHGATAGSGVQKSKLGVTTGVGGIHQVTYNGKPVYWFSQDTKGKVTGNITDQWGKWTAVVVSKPAHNAGSGSGSGSGTSTTNSGGGGVGF